MDSPVLVFDKPTAGLDPYGVSLLLGALKRIQA